MRTLIPILLLLTACGGRTPAADPVDALSSAAVDDSPAPAAPADELVPADPLSEESPPAEPDLVVPEPEAIAEVPPRGPRVTYRVRRGETLDHYARWSGIPVEDLAEQSGLDLLAPLAVGAEVVVPVEGERRAALDLARDAHHARRAEGYLESRGGAVAVETYVVGTGDTAWRIAQDQLGLPVWLLETYNPAVDLDRLRVGERLQYPVIADIVVDAGDLDDVEQAPDLEE